MFESLRLSDLPKRSHGILRGPSCTKPTIWLVKEAGARAVVKDYSTGKPLYRNIIGRFLVWRESKAYKRLRGLRGIPTFYRVIDGLALVIEEIPGRSLKKHEKELKLPKAFFDVLKDIVDNFHRRGLAHCDLKHIPNVLLGSDGLPYVVDWNASISEKEFRFFPLNLIFRRFLLDDYMAIIKLKLQYIPKTVTPKEKRRYHHRCPVEKAVRAIKDRLRKISKKIK
jgi:serine/threonine protein kinase